MTRRALLLAYHFPPAVGIAAERMDAFHRHLPAVGWQPRVVAPRAPHFHLAVSGSGGDAPSVVRTGSLELSRILRWGYGPPEREGGAETDGTVRPLSPGRAGSALRRWAREWLYVPDAQVGWVPFGIRQGRRALERNPADEWVIFSSSVPYSAHLVAGRLARQGGVPWVAEFRDPWTAHEEAFLRRTAFRRSLDRRIEEWILRAADHLVVTSRATREIFLSSFPFLAPERVTVVLNGFEPLPDGSPPGKDRPMALVHAGTLHHPGFARPLLEALLAMEGEGGPGLELHVYGPQGPWREVLSELGRSEPPHWMSLMGLVTPGEAQRAMTRASALLLLLPDQAYARVISGKLLAYLGARRPVFGILPQGSEMETLVGELGEGWWVRPWARDGVREALGALLAKHREGSLQAPTGSEALLRELTRTSLTGTLAGVFRQVTEDRRSR